jgi:hypothetical protein
MNILDIGIFNGLQAMSDEYRTDSSSVSDLVTRVTNTFYRYPQQSLDNCWGVLHENYRLICMCDGGNKICDPHCGIRRRVTVGLDPVNYSIDFDHGFSTDDEEQA